MREAPVDLTTARLLLACRPDACPAEVRAGFRRAVKAARPDLGRVDGPVLDRLRTARDLLLANAGRDRRRRRSTAATVANPQRLRRASWVADTPPPPAVDSYL